MSERFSLGAVIRQRRIELGWTQEELAERISTDDEYVRQSEISRIENGRVELPRRERLLRLAEVLELPAGELLARSGWAGADLMLQSREDASTPPRQRQPEHREPTNSSVNGLAGHGSNSAEQLSENRTDHLAMQNLRRALASLHEQTERLNRNRDRSAEILERVQRPRHDPEDPTFSS